VLSVRTRQGVLGLTGLTGGGGWVVEERAHK
jgi:hypothetical protein